MIDLATASRHAARALDNIATDYPNHPGHLWLGPQDGVLPRLLHPAFHGSYDWHSCVHMHWTLARLRRAFPMLPERDAVAAAFDRHLTAGNIAAECAYFARPGTAGFERTYGWAWLLKLAGELALAAQAGDADAARWAGALAPLARTMVARFDDYLPRAGYPIRHGMHANSAFGLSLALDHARDAGDEALASRLAQKALDWFGDDRDAPIRWEPSGADFLSPALCEADLMRRVLSRAAFAPWFAAFLPALRESRGFDVLAPVTVADREDPQIVHLDGLNLSRAWSLAGIAPALDPGRATAARRAAARHREAGRAGLASGAWVGTHWLATFDVLAALDSPA